MSLYEHFCHLAELPTQEQSSYLDSLDTSVDIEQLREMLKHHQQIDEVTDWHQLVASQVNQMTGDHHLERLKGTKIGPYQLAEVLGQGGMSIVYRAERIDGTFKQNVAIKFLLPSVMNVVGANLVHNEAQILANLEHPNITRVFDAGTTDSGIHYFIMEFIEGQTLDQYCLANKYLTINDKIRLFLDIVEAIQSAHLVNIIHTDIKPSNILVTDEGDIKILDFGIAKLVHGDATSQDHKTLKHYLQAMSLPYASPEQIMQSPLTAKTDQYSLGVLFYQMLSKELPFDSQGYTKQGLLEAKIEGQLVPLKCRFKSWQLRRQVSGDLSYILDKMMHVEPDKRFQNIKAVSSELYRYLKHFPLNDKKHSYAYRFKKWLYRSPAQAAVITVLCSSTLVFYQQKLTIDEERKTAEQVAQQMLHIFKMTDPSQGSQPNLSARDILLKGASSINDDKGISFEARSKLIIGIAESLIGLGFFADAISIVESWANNQALKESAKVLYFKANRLLARAKRGVGDIHSSKMITKRILAEMEQYSLPVSEKLLAYRNLARIGLTHFSQESIDELASYIQMLKESVADVGSDEYWNMRMAEFNAYQESTDYMYFYGDISSSEFAERQREIRILAKEIAQGLPEDHPQFTSLMSSLVWLAVENDKTCSNCRLKAASTIPKLEKRLGKNHRIVTLAFADLATIAELERDYFSNRDYLATVVDRTKARYGELSIEYLQEYLNLARSNAVLGYLEKSEQMRLYAYDLFHQLRDSDSRTELNIGYFHELNDAIAYWEAAGQFARAHPYILQAIELIHSDPIFTATNQFIVETMVMESRKIFIQQGPEIAIEYLTSRQAEFSFPNDSELNFELGRMYHLTSEHQQSIEHFEKAIEALKHYEKAIPAIFMLNIGPQYLQALIAGGYKDKAQLTLNKLYLFNYKVNPSTENFWLQRLTELAQKGKLVLPEVQKAPES